MLVTTVYKGKLQMLEINKNYKKLHMFVMYFEHLGTFIMISLTGRVHV